jgi:hypothetical protein
MPAGETRFSAKMRSKLAFALIVMFSGLLPGPVCAQSGHTARTAKRIHFAPGSICGMAKGRLLAHNSNAYFVVHARAGQHMTVNAVPLSTSLALVGIVVYPSKNQDGSPGGVFFDSRLTETGDYRIRISPHNMANNRLPGAFRLEVVIH